jgi:hypothetical protein
VYLSLVQRLRTLVQQQLQELLLLPLLLLHCSS